MNQEVWGRVHVPLPMGYYEKTQCGMRNYLIVRVCLFKNSYGLRPYLLSSSEM